MFIQNKPGYRKEAPVNNINKYSRQGNTLNIGTKVQRRVLFVLLALLIVAVVLLSTVYLQAASYRTAAQLQFNKRISSAVIDAIDQVSRLTGGVQSNSSSKLALVRQYVYNIDQINEISTAISGEAGRLVPHEAITALYDDLDTYELLFQTATSSTLEIRTTLLTHLTALKELI
jgi:type II secretory pathway pseudopilin PulG